MSSPRSIEVSGKSVDEAIFNGLDQMGLTIDQVDIDIVEKGGKRLFGLANKQSVVRLTERKREAIVEPLGDTIEEAKETITEQKQEAKEQKAQQRREKRRERAPRPRKSRSRGKTERTPAAAKTDAQPCEGGPEGEFLVGLLERMGVEHELECTFSEKNNSKYLQISGKGMGVLIGRRGETLNSIQYLCSLVGNKGGEDFHRVIVDAENYRARRENTLQRLANSRANQVVRTGKSITLEPMNPYDRRIMHSALQDNKDVKTYSVGEEPSRRVVIEKQ